MEILLDILIKTSEWSKWFMCMFSGNQVAYDFFDDTRKIWITARRNPNEPIKKLVLSFVFLLMIT